jgi:hypothetical protein
MHFEGGNRKAWSSNFIANTGIMKEEATIPSVAALTQRMLLSTKETLSAQPGRRLKSLSRPQRATWRTQVSSKELQQTKIVGFQIKIWSCWSLPSFLQTLKKECVAFLLIIALGAEIRDCSEQVDMRKVNLQVIKPWIAKKIVELNGMEDEVLVEYAMSLLEAEEAQPVSDLLCFL